MFVQDVLSMAHGVFSDFVRAIWPRLFRGCGQAGRSRSEPLSMDVCQWLTGTASSATVLLQSSRGSCTLSMHSVSSFVWCEYEGSDYYEFDSLASHRKHSEIALVWDYLWSQYAFNSYKSWKCHNNKHLEDTEIKARRMLSFHRHGLGGIGTAYQWIAWQIMVWS